VELWVNKKAPVRQLAEAIVVYQDISTFPPNLLKSSTMLLAPNNFKSTPYSYPYKFFLRTISNFNF